MGGVATAPGMRPLICFLFSRVQNVGGCRHAAKDDPWRTSTLLDGVFSTFHPDGGGGREHALAWKVAQSTQVDTVYVAPGNAGTASEKKITNIQINAEDINALKIFAEKESVDLTVVGPEQPLVAGIVDEFRKAKLPCFGPTKAAAILEGSKSFSKDFLKKYKIPTAEYEVFSEESSAINYIKSKNANCY